MLPLLEELAISLVFANCYNDTGKLSLIRSEPTPSVLPATFTLGVCSRHITSCRLSALQGLLERHTCLDTSKCSHCLRHLPRRCVWRQSRISDQMKRSERRLAPSDPHVLDGGYQDYCLRSGICVFLRAEVKACWGIRVWNVMVTFVFVR